MVDEQLRALIDEIRCERALLADLRREVLDAIDEGFRGLRLENSADPHVAVPIPLCEVLYEAIYQITGAVPFTAARIIEESRESTADAERLRGALVAVLPEHGVTYRKLSGFLRWDVVRETKRWCLHVSPKRTSEGRKFQICRRDEK